MKVLMSDFAKMSEVEFLNTIQKMDEWAKDPKNIQHQLDLMNQEIAFYEQRYHISSEELKNQLDKELIKEDQDICEWLMTLHIRDQILEHLKEKNNAY